MQRSVDISIVVSCWNASEIIEEALDSIIATANDMSFDVTVIDDASTDGGIEYVAKKFAHDSRFSFVQNEKNVGFSALNIMLERTRAPYILTLDTDARLQTGALQALYAFMETHPEAGAATGNLRNADNSAQMYYRRLLTPTLYFFTTPMGRFFDKYLFKLYFYKKYHYYDLDLTRISELEQPPVACLLLRREALGKQILDPIYRLFMIDVDLCKGIYDRGYKIFLVPAAKVFHLKTASASKRGRVWLERELNRSFMLFFKKQYPYLVPLLWFVIIFDRMLRELLVRTLKHEPMR